MLALVALGAFVALSNGVVIDRVDRDPIGWIERRRADPDQPINLKFAVKQQNRDVLDQKLLDISHPDSDQYGNWMTMEEVHALVAPSVESVTAVQYWLKQNGFVDSDIVSVTRNSDFLGVQTTISKAEALLDCKYYEYIHGHKNQFKTIRVQIGTNYNVPESVADHLDFVAPTKRFPSVSSLRVNTVGAGEVTPTVLRNLYNLGDTEGKVATNAVAVASFRDQYYSLQDLETFWKTYDLDPSNVTNVPANSPSGQHLEAELDTQYITGMGEKVPLQVWWTQGVNFDNALLEWATNIVNSDNPPPLFSVSYGETETQAGESFVDRLNAELQKVGAAGVTVFFAAGDSGAGGGCGITEEAFQPDYPAASPYVTAVGGVKGGKAGNQPLGETVWIDGGGGFSNYAGRQSWQSDAVANYLSTNKQLPSSKAYNASGRGFPDIAAQSVDFAITRGDGTVAVDGTSCSSPTSAGIFGLLNDLRMQNNMAAIGFANPLIYSLAAKYDDAFNDCTSGFNEGCGGSISEGFYAQEGWDPASGNGSPDYATLAKYVLETGEKTKKFVEQRRRRRRQM